MITGLFPYDADDQDAEHLCWRAIVTFDCFANAPHVAKGDLLCLRDKLDAEVATGDYLASTNIEYMKKVQYARGFIDRYGVGVPIICVYPYIHNEYWAKVEN